MGGAACRERSGRPYPRLNHAFPLLSQLYNSSWNIQSGQIARQQPPQRVVYAAVAASSANASAAHTSQENKCPRQRYRGRLWPGGFKQLWSQHQLQAREAEQGRDGQAQQDKALPAVDNERAGGLGAIAQVPGQHSDALCALGHAVVWPVQVVVV